MKRETLINLLVFALLVSLGVATRWLSNIGEPTWSNFTATGAVALFAGYFFTSRLASLLAPLAVLVISNLSLPVFNNLGQMVNVFFAFLLPVLLGWLLKSRLTAMKVFGFAGLHAVIFFLVSNFVFWPGYAEHPQTLAGQWQSYVAALPFFRNMLAADLLFTGLIFGVYRAAVSAGMVARPVPNAMLATGNTAE